MKSAFKTAALAAAVLLVFSCASSKKNIKPEKPYLEFDYFQDGQKYLELKTADAFFSHLTEYEGKFPLSQKRLINNYSDLQKKLLNSGLEKNAVFEAQHYYNNLKTFSPVSETENSEMQKSFYKAFKNAGLEYSARAVIFNNELTDVNAEYAKIKNISDYTKILARIDVNIAYKNEENVQKKYKMFGSGFLVKENYLLTNYHVIQDIFYDEVTQWSITAELNSKKIKATVEAWDSITDLALLKLSEPAVMPFEMHKHFGNSSKIVQGYTVYTLGNHKGYNATLTKGIISAAGRKVFENTDLIQIDAGTAGGASGGLLIGENGLIYGIIVGGSRTEDEISFAIPSNAALELIDKMLSGINISRPWTGLLLDTREEAGNRVVINYIFPSSPLLKFKTKPGEFINKINGTDIKNIDDAKKIIDSLEAGNAVTMELETYSAVKYTVFFTLPRKPDNAIYSTINQLHPMLTHNPLFGFQVYPDTAGTKTLFYNNKKYTLYFHRVSEIKSGSVLDNEGVKTGDYLCFFDDYYYWGRRYIKVLHLPDKKDLKTIKDIDNFIYTFSRDKYDEKVL